MQAGIIPGLCFFRPVGLSLAFHRVVEFCPMVRSQGGVQFPTGGNGVNSSARERSTSVIGRGQQIWCNSRADGDSPDKRERASRLRRRFPAPGLALPVRPDSP